MKNIAIDGPAGAGKSTIAKAVAKRLKIMYMDTGSLYRAVAFHQVCSRSNVCAIDKLSKSDVTLKYIGGVQHVLVCGMDVTDRIRSPNISMLASKISAIPRVRKFLIGIQRDFASCNDVVLDGRDIGTIVLPKADVKIFITADVNIRAKRRYFQQIEQNCSINFNDVLNDIKIRDSYDSSRSISPLRRAKDAVLLDNSCLSLEQSINYVMDVVRSKFKSYIIEN